MTTTAGSVSTTPVECWNVMSETECNAASGCAWQDSYGFGWCDYGTTPSATGTGPATTPGVTTPGGSTTPGASTPSNAVDCNQIYDQNLCVGTCFYEGYTCYNAGQTVQCWDWLNQTACDGAALCEWTESYVVP